MTREEVRIRIAELDKQINSEVGGARLPPATLKRGFPWTGWLIAGAALGWAYMGADIPAAAEVHRDYGELGLYVAALFGAMALWSTALFLMQPGTKITPEYRASTERVRVMQEERRELVSRLRELEQV